MGDKIFKEEIFTIGPFSLKVLGDGPRTYFFRVHSTEKDFSTSAGLVAELSRHIESLRKLREAVEERN